MLDEDRATVASEGESPENDDVVVIDGDDSTDYRDILEKAVEVSPSNRSDDEDDEEVLVVDADEEIDCTMISEAEIEIAEIGMEDVDVDVVEAEEDIDLDTAAADAAAARAVAKWVAKAGQDSLGQLSDDSGQVNREIDHLRAMYIRKLAEFDNYRKRVEREKSELKRSASEAVIRDLLSVIDNFDRALMAPGDVQPASFLQGVEMIARQMKDLLKRFKVETIAPKPGDVFNPEVHDAISSVDSEELAPGAISTLILPGYLIEDKLLRPAMVVVVSEANGNGDTHDGETGGDADVEHEAADGESS